MVDRKASQVYVVDDVPADGDAVTWDASLRQWAPRAGGGGSAGGVTVYSKAFAYNTPGLDAGVTVLTPAVGDVLLDAWFVVTEAFDGTTPLLDIGTFVGGANGLFWWQLAPIACDAADDDGGAGTGMLVSLGTRSLSRKANEANGYTWQVTFTDDNPLKLVVSQDGSAGGTAIGGATGAGTLYLLVASPVAL